MNFKLCVVACLFTASNIFGMQQISGPGQTRFSEYMCMVVARMPHKTEFDLRKIRCFSAAMDAAYAAKDSVEISVAYAGLAGQVAAAQDWDQLRACFSRLEEIEKRTRA